MRKGVIVAALCGALAAGCAGGGAPDGDVSPTPPAEDPTTNAVGTPTPSPSASAEAPPEVDLTAEDGDYRRVVEEILRFREWLFAHPHRQDLVSVIYNEDCLCHQGLVDRLQAYVDVDQYVEATTVIDGFDVTESDSLSFRVLLTWTISGQVLDSEGRVVDESDGVTSREEWFFLRDANGRYRVAGQDDG